MALGGAFLFQRLHVPSGVMLGAAVGVILHNLAIRQVVALPAPANFLAYAGLGWVIGQGVTRQSLAAIRSAALPIVVIVLGLMLAGGLVAAVLARTTSISGISAFLASSPGALSQMAILSRETGSDTLLVVTVHMLRVITVSATAPLVARYLSRW